MTQIANRRTIPKSVRQKQILDVAEANPDASLEEIADEVPGTTTAVVEQVLDEYGDPAVGDSSTDSTTAGGDSEHDLGSDDSPDDVESDADSTSSGGYTGDDPSDAGSLSDGETPDEPSSNDVPVENRHESIGEPTPDGNTPTDVIDFPNRQQELLESIYEYPEATQRELAGHLGVSRTTVYNRVRNIDGLEWDDRQGFVDALFNGEAERAEGESDADAGERGIRAGDGDDGTRETERSKYDDGDGTPDGSRGDGEFANAGAITGTDSGVGISDLLQRVEAIESHLDDLPAESRPDGLSSDPELVHKVAHACLKSDVISEEEELRVLQNLLE